MTIKSGKAPYISPEELKHTLNTQSGKHSVRNQVILLVSHFLGLRAKEMASLKISDVYDHQREVLKDTVRLIAAYTKGGKYREVYLVDPFLKELLLKYLIDERSPVNPNEPLFRSQKGKGFTADTMQKLIKICYKKSGITATSHTGRRSFATNLIDKGADIYSIKLLMGHSSIQTTQEYFSSNPNKLKDQLLKLNQ
jgi:integrase/recombinase XerD